MATQQTTTEEPDVVDASTDEVQQDTVTPDTAETPVDEESTDETAPETAPDADATADADEPAKEEEESEDLDDDTLDAIAEAYGERLLKGKRLSTTVAKQVREEVSRQVREQQSATDSTSRIDQLISQGKTAAESMQRLAGAATEELKKAVDDEAYTPNANIFDPREFATSMEQYGAATAQYERHVLETATQEGFDSVFGEVLPELSDEQVDDLKTLASNTNRMRGDSRQYNKADGYWMSELIQFVAKRAMEHGAEGERTRLASRSVVKGKIAGTNAVKAARAKIEADKGPPRTPKSDPTPTITEFSEAGYREIKKTNDPVKIQDYTNRWAMSRTVGRRQ